MRLLRRRGSPVDHVLHYSRRNTTYIGRYLIRDPERCGKNLFRCDNLTEETVKELVSGRVDSASGGEVKCTAGSYEAWEEETAACLHAETTATKHKANLGVAAHNADIGAESHCDTHANSRAIDSDDNRLVAAI